MSSLPGKKFVVRENTIFPYYLSISETNSEGTPRIDPFNDALIADVMTNDPAGAAFQAAGVVKAHVAVFILFVKHCWTYINAGFIPALCTKGRINDDMGFLFIDVESIFA